MKDIEAINRLTADIVRMSRRQNRILTALLIASIALNILLTSMMFQVNYETSVSGDPLMLTAIAMKKSSDHIKTRQKIKDIAEVKTFDELIERCMLTDEDKFILREHYLHGRSFQSIAMQLNYSEDTIKHRHQKMLKKIQQII